MSPYPPVELRALTVADAERLAVLHRTGFADDPWDADSFRALLASPGMYGVLAADAMPRGFVLARAIADEAEIITLVVVPEARRAGIGALLLAQAEAIAGDRGATHLLLEVAADNAAARALYRAAGYRQAGRRRRYYRNSGDALILRRDW